MRTAIHTHIACLLIALVACKGKENPSAVDSTAAVKPPDTMAKYMASDTSLSFVSAKTATTTVYLDSVHTSVNFYLQVDSGKQIHAVLKPERPQANVRFNQVIAPDGSADGPFGQTLITPISQKGKYTLRIGPSPMAEGRYKGFVRVDVIIE